MPDDGDVDLVVPGLDAGLGLASEDVDKEVQLVPHLNVPGFDVRTVHLGLDVALDGAPVPLHGGNGLDEEEE